MQLGAGCLGKARKGPCGGQYLSTFPSGHNLLLGSHSVGKLFLRQSGMRTRTHKRARYGEFAFKCVELFLVSWVVHPAGMQITNFAHHSTCLARLSASSISRPGVFWVFFTKTLTITTRCPVAAT